MEPKNNYGVSFVFKANNTKFSIEKINSEEAEIVRNALVSAGLVKIADDFETRRELAIMHDVLDNKDKPFLERWSYGNRNDIAGIKNRYKIKHKTNSFKS